MNKHWNLNTNKTGQMAHIGHGTVPVMQQPPKLWLRLRNPDVVWEAVPAYPNRLISKCPKSIPGTVYPWHLSLIFSPEIITGDFKSYKVLQVNR